MNLLVVKPHANFIVFLRYGILTHVFSASSLCVLLSISCLCISYLTWREGKGRDMRPLFEHERKQT